MSARECAVSGRILVCIRRTSTSTWFKLKLQLSSMFLPIGFFFTELTKTVKIEA